MPFWVYQVYQVYELILADFWSKRIKSIKFKLYLYLVWLPFYEPILYGCEQLLLIKA